MSKSRFNRSASRPDKKPTGLRFTRGKWRWEPSAKDRARGIAARNLVNDDGTEPSQWQAYEIANKLNADLATGVIGPSHGKEDERRDLNALAQKFFESGVYFTSKAPKTQASYRGLITALCKPEHFGGVPVSAIDRHEAEEHFVKIQMNGNVKHAHALKAMLRRLMTFAVALKWRADNPILGLASVKPSKGRKVSWHDPEIVAYVRAAEWLGVPCQADAIILALCLGQSVDDILSFPPLTPGDGIYHERLKTGKSCYPPKSPLLVDRTERMNRRNAKLWPGRAFATQLIYTGTGKPYTYGTFNRIHYAVRLLASGNLDAFNDSYEAKASFPKSPLKVNSLADLPFDVAPTLADKWMSDLRDTSFTRYAMSGGLLAATMISGHAVKRDIGISSAALIDASYLDRENPAARQMVKDSGAARAFDDLYPILCPRPRAGAKAA